MSGRGAAMPTNALAPTIRIPFAVTEITPAAQAAAGRVLASGWVTSGPEVAAFEGELAAYLGVPYAVATSSCTAAIELGLRALRLPPGAPVLTSVMTFCGAVHAIVHAGLRPVLVDVDAATLMPSPETVVEAVRRHGPVSAMVVVHFAGYPAPVAELAAAAGLGLDFVIEDAAHAIGTAVGDEPVGTISRATCFSFYATKNLPIGEGGMLTTADAELAAAVRSARLHGMTSDAWRRYLPGGGWRYSVDEDGIKANLTDLQAAIGRAQLSAFDGWQERRRVLADRYDAGLADVGGITVPCRPSAGRHAWHLYVVRVEASYGLTRDELVGALAEVGIGTSVHFIPLHHQSYFQRLLGSDLDDGFPVVDAVFPGILSLPLHPALSVADVDDVCTALDLLGRARRRSLAVA